MREPTTPALACRASGRARSGDQGPGRQPAAPSGNPPMWTAPWPRSGQAAKRRKEFSYGRPYMQPPRLIQNLNGYSGAVGSSPLVPQKR